MNKKYGNGLKKRDLLVVMVAILAIVGLFVAVRLTQKNEQHAQEELIENAINDEMTAEEDNSSASEESFVINEVSSDGNVELYNNGRKPVSIGGFSVYVGNELCQTIEAGYELKSGELYTIYTKHDFSSSSDNLITVVNNDGVIEKALAFSVIGSGNSYGCITDGSIETGYITPSIGYTNTESEVVDIDRLLFSVPSGFYEDSFDLAISTPRGCKVYYTLDGTIPSTESTEYSEPIRISRPAGNQFVYAVSDGKGYTYVDEMPTNVDLGTIVRAIAVDSDGNIKEDKTASYYIGYNMDSDYSGLPVISIETDPDNLFDFEKGIYVLGKSYYDGLIQGNDARANYRSKQYVEARIEYFEGCKDQTYSANMSLAVFHDRSLKAGQKSFVLKTTKACPNGTSLDHYLNEASCTLYLLAGGSDSVTKIRRSFVNTLVEGTSIFTRYYSPCIVFIDGEYWGMYYMASSYDSKFFEEKYGITDDVLAVTSDYNAPEEYTSLIDYVENTDFSVTENYEQLKSMIDIDNYIEYMCINIYIGNTSLWNNQAACIWRTKESKGTGYTDGRWRWALNDVECTLNNSFSYLSPYRYGKFSDPMLNTYLTPGIRDNKFFNSLLQNDAFCQQFMDTMNDLMDNQFNRALAEEILAEESPLIYKAVLSTMNRFSAGSSGTYDNDISGIKSFFDIRPRYLRIYTEEYIGQKGNVASLISVEDATDDGVSTEESVEEVFEVDGE